MRNISGYSNLYILIITDSVSTQVRINQNIRPLAMLAIVVSHVLLKETKSLKRRLILPIPFDVHIRIVTRTS